MIPKIIHYCWFGGAPLPADAKKYIEGWHRFCPDYEFRRWDETTFDVHSVPFVEEAYKAGKWAFVTDYVRLFALYTVGGIYMDTDVEVLKPLDRFLTDHGFSGFEKATAVPTGIMGAEKGLPCLKSMYEEYRTRHFVRPDGTYDLHTNVEDITRYFTARGLRLDNTLQTVDGFTFYPKDFFCPLDNRTYELGLTDNSYTIHHFAGSWIGDRAKLRNRKLKKLLGPRLTKMIVSVREALGLSKH